MTRLAAEIRSHEAHYLAVAERCAELMDTSGCADALRVVAYFRAEAERREKEDREFDSLLDRALGDESGVRRAPGLEGVRERIRKVVG
jgi:hypothetical protein